MSDQEKLDGDCPRQFELIRLAAGDGDEKELNAWRAHTDECPECGSVLTSLGKHQQDFLKRHPFEAIAPRLLEGPRRRRLLRLVPAAAAAAVLVVAGILWFAASPEPTIRTKGDITLAFYVQKGAEAVPGQTGGVYRENDRIQFTYSSGPNRYVFLVSLDDQGTVSNFNHKARTTSVPIRPGSNRVLEGSIILDGTVGPERIFAVFSNRPLHFDEIKDAADRAFGGLQKAGASVRELKRLPLPYSQATVLLMKK